MSQVPLDPDTYLRVKDAMVRATRLGLDFAEELNRANLLLTPAQDKLIRLQAMNYLLRQVTSWRPAEFLRRKFLAEHPATPKDMYICIVEFIEEHIAWWEKEQ